MLFVDNRASSPRRVRGTVASLVLLAVLLYLYTFWTSKPVPVNGLLVCQGLQDKADVMFALSMLDSVLTLILPYSALIFMHAMILREIIHVYRTSSLSPHVGAPEPMLALEEIPVSQCRTPEKQQIVDPAGVFEDGEADEEDLEPETQPVQAECSFSVRQPDFSSAVPEDVAVTKGTGWWHALASSHSSDAVDTNLPSFCSDALCRRMAGIGHTCEKETLFNTLEDQKRLSDCPVELSSLLKKHGNASTETEDAREWGVVRRGRLGSAPASSLAPRYGQPPIGPHTETPSCEGQRKLLPRGPTMLCPGVSDIGDSMKFARRTLNGRQGHCNPLNVVEDDAELELKKLQRPSQEQPITRQSQCYSPDFYVTKRSGSENLLCDISDNESGRGATALHPKVSLSDSKHCRLSQQDEKEKVFHCTDVSSICAETSHKSDFQSSCLNSRKEYLMESLPAFPPCLPRRKSCTLSNSFSVASVTNTGSVPPKTVTLLSSYPKFPTDDSQIPTGSSNEPLPSSKGMYSLNDSVLQSSGYFHATDSVSWFGDDTSRRRRNQTQESMRERKILEEDNTVHQSGKRCACLKYSKPVNHLDASFPKSSTSVASFECWGDVSKCQENGRDRRQCRDSCSDRRARADIGSLAANLSSRSPSTVSRKSPPPARGGPGRARRTSSSSVVGRLPSIMVSAQPLLRPRRSQSSRTPILVTAASSSLSSDTHSSQSEARLNAEGVPRLTSIAGASGQPTLRLPGPGPPKRSHSSGGTVGDGDSSINYGSTVQKQTATMLLIVVVVFLLLNLPIHLIRLQALIRHRLQPGYATSLSEHLCQQLFQILYFVNFAVNFIIYSAYSSSFRAALLRLPLQLRERLSTCVCYCLSPRRSLDQAERGQGQQQDREDTRLVDIHLSEIHLSKIRSFNSSFACRSPPFLLGQDGTVETTTAVL